MQGMVPVDYTCGVLTRAAVVEILTGVVEVAPVTNSCSCNVYL